MTVGEAEETVSVASAFKSLVSNGLFTASQKQRISDFNRVSSVIRNPPETIPENAFKALAKTLPMVLPRLRDGTSRKAAMDLISLIVEQKGAVVGPAMIQSLWDSYGKWKELVPTKANAKTAMAILKWLSILYKELDLTENDPSSVKFCELLAVMVAVICGAQNPQLKNNASKELRKMWNMSSKKTEIAIKIILKNEAQSQQSIILGSCLIEWLRGEKRQSEAEQAKKVLLDSLVKLVISSKSKSRPDITQSLNSLLKLVNHEDFKNVLLPPMHKAMLRNPETILYSIGYIVSGVNIDLSQYVQEMMKPFGSNLHAKDIAVRDDAIFATAALAAQCSDPEAIDKILKSIFALLNGSEGKIAVNDQKCSLLQAAGRISSNAVTGNAMQNNCNTAFESFIKVLESEVHEGSLIEALTNLSLWSARLVNSIPSKFVEWFPKGVGQKTSTSSVRMAYFSCLFAALKSITLSSALPLVPTLKKSVENCANQSSQVATVSEGIHAAACLIKLSVMESDMKENLEEFWRIVLDANKQLFCNERFLLAASPATLACGVTLAENVVMEKVSEAAPQAPWLRLIAVALTCNETKTRNAAGNSIDRLLSGLGGESLAVSLLKELNGHLRSEPVTLLGSTAGKDIAEGNSSVSPKFVVNGIKKITKACKLDEGSCHKIAIAKALLNICHLKEVNETYRGLWKELFQSLKLNDSLNGLFFKDIVDNILSGEVSLESIPSVITVNADVVVPILVSHLTKALDNPDLSTITVENYQIFLSPKGEIFNKQVLESIENEKDVKNVKRENKAYSYKEQMEEIALRKELEEKKRREGKIAPPKLTPKQKELLNAQLEKEDAIRQDVQKLQVVVDPILSLTRIALKSEPKPFAAFVREISSRLFKGFKSPLVAKKCSEIFSDLRRSVFEVEDDLLSQNIASMIIQIKNPSFDMTGCLKSSAEVLKAACSVVQKIGESTVESMAQDSDLVCPFTTPAFCYTFPILDYVLKKSLKDPKMLAIVLNIIGEHADLRGVGEESSSLADIDQLHPHYLPTMDMLRVLTQTIENTKGREQQTAVSCLIEVARASSNQPGCAKMKPEEIQVLLGALQSGVSPVRDAALRGLDAIIPALPNRHEGLYGDLIRRMWVARFDVEQENRNFAIKLWKSAELEKDEQLCFTILDDIIHPVSCIRSAACNALADLLEEQTDDTSAILTLLLDTYKEKMVMTLPIMDNLGRVVQEPIDSWESRSGIAIALKKIARFYNVEMVETIATFLVPTALDDRNETVRAHMLEAAVSIVDIHGKETAEELLPVFEKFMDESATSAKFDHVRQSVVILMGSMAKHLDPSDPKVRPIMRQLIMALNTPSQSVQEAVAQCLPPLVPTIKDEAPDIVSTLIVTLLGSKNSYGERKGAAYGIAGIVKGLGILSLKQLDIMGKLTEAIQDKKNPTHREGALFAFEMLCNMLGRLFEPYIVHIIPHLLMCFGDPVEHVRQAADDTARTVMSKLSAHGVKLILPSLLNAIEEEQWRTKSGSVELLGAMAFCAPKQLSSCLPSIVPKLIEVLGDSHHRVQEAGEQALKQIGSVIRNPEIQAIVPVLLKALEDPAKKTGVCLQTLLDTKFVHFIDAPSLALIMPVVQRAFQDRSTETRKMAAQIIGNMYSLTDQKDLSPYLPGIIPGLKNSLLDPVPEVRAVSARALGAMVKGLGEASFEELLPWLMSTLTSEASSVDRSGAAQGLAEVVGGLGVEKMNALMPDIVKTAARNDIAPHVKDGYIMMFIYMPGVFPEEFTPYIAQIISPVLRALADENEFVRETAYKAGQRLVTAYAETAITLLLPELENGMFDENWRIRHSSVQLLGDLLYRISGVTGKMSTETAGEDENFGTEQSQKAITSVLGIERRNRVLAGLYMGRSDVALMVRQASLHVWKVIVSNTPKTLREILPTLFNLLLGCLASSSYDKRQIAARTLGDLVKKLGERVLPEIIPILEKGLDSEQPEKRQGVCVGLSEIMQSTSRDMVMTFVDSLVPTVRKALCDDLPEVREAAAKSFDSLHNTVGSRALDEILPVMLKQLDDEDLHDNTLDGLKQVMAIKSRAVLPYLIPQLIAKPVNTKALANLAPVAGEALNRHLARILPALLGAMADSFGTEEGQVIQEHAETVILSIDDDEDDTGVRVILEELLRSCKSDQMETKRGSITLLCSFCSQSKVDLSQYVPQLMRSFILLFTEEDEEVLKQAWNALASVTKSLDVNEQMAHVADVRQAVRFAMMDVKNKDNLLPGFCLPKGIAPILPIFRESILNGPPELKEQAAMGLGEVINVTSAAALKPSVVHITGPLIRILGDRFSHGVKIAVLDTLAALLSKAKDMLKPFFPQLQTTFLKALNDVNRTVRLKAGIALGYLIVIHMRPDPIFNDLLNGIKNSDDVSIRDTYLQALRGCLEPSGKTISAPIQTQMLNILIGFLSHADDSSRIAGAGCLAALCKWLSDEDLAKIVDAHLIPDEAGHDWVVSHGRSTALFAALKMVPERIYTNENESKINQNVLHYLHYDRIPIVENGVRCVCYLFDYCIRNDKPVPEMLIVPFCKTMNHSSNEVKLLVAVVSDYLAKTVSPNLLSEHILKPLIPMLVNGTKEKNSAVKSTSETSLVSVLQLREGKKGQVECLALLEPGARTALEDAIEKVLARVAKQPRAKEEVIDNTILS